MRRTTIFFGFRVGPRSRQSRSTAAPGPGFFPIRSSNQGFDPRGGRPDTRGPTRPGRREAANQGATDVLRSAEASYDVVIVGAGHNGLVCAFYLARAGLRVKVVERRAVVGGAAVTEELHPGFRNSVCSYVVSLLHPKVIADLDLARHGLEILERPGGSPAALGDGRCLLLPRDGARAEAEIARFSGPDAEAYGRFHEVLEEAARVLCVRSCSRPRPKSVAAGATCGARPPRATPCASWRRACSAPSPGS